MATERREDYAAEAEAQVIVRDNEGWYIRLWLGPRLWVVLGRWKG